MGIACTAGVFTHGVCLLRMLHAADGALVLAANKEARKPEKTIDSDDDSYMKNVCSAQKWLILELSQVRREVCGVVCCYVPIARWRSAATMSFLCYALRIAAAIKA